MSLLRLRKLASQLGTSAQRGISGTNTRAFSSSREIFSKDGKQSAKLFTLKNDAGMEVTISDWGGCITHIKVPNKDGEFQDVAVCPDTVEGLQNNSPYLGAMIGRTAGRTENAQFEVDGKTYHITKNNGEHNLHGGNVGFHNAKWAATEGSDSDSVYVSLKYVSPDGEDGYPGSLATTCQYRLSKSRNKLSLNITAESTAPTPVNITNHSYFNLKGHTNGDVLDHVVQIHGKRYVETDKDVIATGKLLDVKGTAMDFTAGKAVGKDIGFFTGEMAFLKGYDHCFLIDKKSAKQQPDGTRHCATVSADGRTMKVFTDLPAVHLYTGNWLDGSLTGKAGKKYTKHGGLCFECQNLANSHVLHGKQGADPAFSSIIVSPGNAYKSIIAFEFV